MHVRFSLQFSAYKRPLLLTVFGWTLGFAPVYSTDSLSGTPSKEVFYYLQSTGSNTDTVYRSISIVKNKTIITYDAPQKISSRAVCDEQLRVESWHFVNKETGYDITAVRAGAAIRVTGTKGAKPITKSVAIDTLPWYQSMEFSLLPFLERGGQSCEFWMFRPTDMQAFKMVVIRKGIETILVNGRTEPAVKVSLSPSGALGKFWQASYWYRRSDYRFLKSTLPGILPGSVPLIVELLDKKRP